MSRKSTHSITTIVLLLLAISNECLAEVEVGVGILVNPVYFPYSTAISIPIKTSDSFMLEPAIGFRLRKTDFERNENYQDEINQDTWYFSLGLYGLSQIKKNFEMYYGATIGGERFKYESHSKFTGIDSTFSENYNEQRMFVRPTLGFSYFVNPHFSVGIDVGLYIYKGKAEQSYYDSDFGQSDTDRTNTLGAETETNVILRYMF